MRYYGNHVLYKYRSKKLKICVIGSGISGLSAGWLLSQKHQVTLFESADYLGGHTNTVDVTLEGVTHPVDTGFLVHNDLTYPNLISMLSHLGVATYPSNMSFSVKLPNQGIEWAGSNLKTVFGQKANMVRPGFLGMLRDILRFNKQAQELLGISEREQLTLGQLLDREGYAATFSDWYLLPMAAAIWSSSPRDILEFPASTFLRFCLNHRLLQVKGRPEWRSIVGGGRSYVEKLAAPLDIQLGSPVSSLTRSNGQVTVTSNGNQRTFDAAVLATHAPDSLRILADADNEEAKILGAVSYQPNLAILHTDRRLLPQRESLWSAWNYLSAGNDKSRSVCVTYLLNRLQNLPFKTPLMVTLNPPEEMIPEGEIARFHYDHPVFDKPAISAQKQISSIQGKNLTWFCGAWCGYGFHEDGLKSALNIISDFNVEAPWEVVL